MISILTADTSIRIFGYLATPMFSWVTVLALMVLNCLGISNNRKSYRPFKQVKLIFKLAYEYIFTCFHALKIWK